MSGFEALDAVLAEARAERLRQIEVHGFTAVHDDTERRCQILRAALAYGHHAYADLRGKPRPVGLPHPEWPWKAEFWHPKAPRRTLVVAAALIVAEIERLDRLAASRKEDADA